MVKTKTPQIPVVGNLLYSQDSGSLLVYNGEGWESVIHSYEKPSKTHLTNCPNCGAPLHNGNCEYCGTEVFRIWK